jgi:phosphatidylinositol alpha-mannosyltransferase
VRVGLVSPYSYTYPGGVAGHVEALADELIREGHDVRLLAPYDPDDRHARIAHRGARPERRPVPDHLISLGRTIGIPANGAVSNLALTPFAVSVLARELRYGGYDVIHVHEPNAPMVSWFATETARVPLVGTFHAHSTGRVVNHVTSSFLGARRLYNRLHVRIAVSAAARWTAERFYGGRYRLIPNGVDLTRAPSWPVEPSDELRLLFVGRAEARKGLPVLLRSFEALRAAGVEARLTVAGATEEEVEPYLLEREGIEIAGRVTEDEKWRLLHEADLLCAPSLGGESFGMVLTEAFAAGTPVVASDIAGYRDVVRPGTDALLVPAGDPVALGEGLQELALEPVRRRQMAAAARERAERFAWPRIGGEVMSAYEDAIELASSQSRSLAARVALRPADGEPVRRPRRLPSIEPADPPGAALARVTKVFRRAAIAAGAVAGIGLGALALQRIGLHSIARAVVAATPVWVLVALALMCVSMFLRAESWHAILKAALPGTRVRRRDATRGVMIGVLMSATLPARLGEPSRALIVARRLGRVRERLPVVLGTLVSQTIFNLVALLMLGTVMFATVDIFKKHEGAVIAVAVAPVAALAAVLAAPALLRRGAPSRFVRVQRWAAKARKALVGVRHGLIVFRRPKLGVRAAVTQLLAWGIQWLACYSLLVALGLDGRAGIGAAAAVLFAVNVTAVLPATPSNLGVFQAACVAVLSAYHVSHTDALAYGIILQAVEIATAVTLGMPALLREGMTWQDLRLRTLNASPVELPVKRRRPEAEAKTWGP